MKNDSSQVQLHSQVEAVRERLVQHLRGKAEIVEKALAAFLARGHILLEGPPGVGKTSLAKAMGGAFGGTFHRIQMTSDLLPSDVVGILRVIPGGTEFEFRPGPVFAHFVLADELNRTSPKTQSALLEAMAEGTVSADGRSHQLPQPFFLVATQNPIEFQGVYPLAESQLDRFMLELEFSPPGRADELEIYRGSLTAPPEVFSETRAEAPVMDLHGALRLREKAASVHVENTVLEYITDLVQGTRNHSELAFGVSVRAGMQLLAAARGLAFVRGREFVTPRDVIDLAVPALAHRLVFHAGEVEHERRLQAVEDILKRVPAPK